MIFQGSLKAKWCLWEKGEFSQHVNLITFLEARKLLSKGCYVYLAHVLDPSVVEPRLEDVLMVEEFSDIFLDDLLGLPPNKEIEFVINLLSCTAKFLKPY